MLRSSRARRLLLPAAVAAVMLAGCGSSVPAPSGGGPAGSTAGAGASSGHSTVAVVATTNVYASIASTIGGDRVQASAILDKPSADPHSFEAAPKDQVKIAQAQLVIANGGGYDDFANQMVDAAHPKPQLIDATEVSGLQESSGAGTFNEHVFYSTDAMRKLGAAIAAKLGELDPADKAIFTKNADGFAAKLAELDLRAAAIKTTHPGVKALVTEPVADYLLQEAGITDLTPKGYSQAIESENDPSAKDIAEVDGLIRNKSAGLLVYNEQTTGPVPDRVRQQAEKSGVPVLAVTETLPAGTTDYLTWMAGTIDALDKALTKTKP